MFSFLLRLSPRSPLFPYTTLFRSDDVRSRDRARLRRGQSSVRPPQPDEPGKGRATEPTGREPAPGRRLGPHAARSEEHTSELQSRGHLVCRLLLEKKNKHTSQAAR